MAFGRNGKGSCRKGAKWESLKKWLLGEMKKGENEIGRNGKRTGQILGEWEKGEVGKGEKRMGEMGKIRAKWIRAKWDWANWE